MNISGPEQGTSAPGAPGTAQGCPHSWGTTVLGCKKYFLQEDNISTCFGIIYFLDVCLSPRCVPAPGTSPRDLLVIGNVRWQQAPNAFGNGQTGELCRGRGFSPHVPC